MSARNTIELALFKHHRRDADPNASAKRTLAQYDSERAEGTAACAAGARETIRNVLLVHYADSPNPALVVDTLMANGTAENEQAYDGELAMLRGLVRTLRVVVRPDEVDVAEVRRLLWEHASDDAAAREEKAAPDFFQPGRTYAYDASGFTAPELLTVFRVVVATTHPETGKRMAFGWIRTAEDVQWSPYAEPADEWPACWTDVTEGGGVDV